MKSYFLMGVRFSRLISLLITHKGASLRYWPRLFPLLFSGIITEFFVIAEKVRFGRILKETPVPRDPLFIISHWRTGSTLLHELICLDKGFTTPRLLDTITPEHFLISSRYYSSPLSRFVGGTRPMDNFTTGIDSPTEHEFALLKMAAGLPIERTIFLADKQKGYFLGEADLDSGVPVRDEGLRKAFKHYLTKISFHDSGKKIVLKNPWDSLRIGWLKKEFPDAKFLHIYRNPINVVPSTAAMWNTIVKDNLLRGCFLTPAYRDITRYLSDMEQCIEKGFSSLSASDYSSISYEELISDPAETLEHAFNNLSLEMTDEHRDAIPRYMRENRGNRSKLRTPSPDAIGEIRDVMKEYLNGRFPEYT